LLPIGSNSLSVASRSAPLYRLQALVEKNKPIY